MTASSEPEDSGAPPFDPEDYRRTLGCFATGVTIITTRQLDGECAGLTVNSFNSVSLDPPLVLWSLSLFSQSLLAFQEASHFAVNILAVDQVELSNRFATRRDDKFDGLEYTLDECGVPLLAGCAAHLVCRQQYRHYGGDHIIFIGRVASFARTDREPLVFCQGDYRVARPLPPDKLPGGSK